MTSPKVFTIPASHRWRFLVLGLAFLLLGSANVALASLMLTRPARPQVVRQTPLPESAERRPKKIFSGKISYLSSALLGLLFVGAGLNMLRKGVFYSAAGIAVDEEGLWPASLDRNATLLLWRDIAGTKERPYWQRLDLLGIDGEKRLALDYELADLYELRSIIGRRMAAGRSDWAFPLEIHAPKSRNLALGVILALFIVLGLYTLVYGRPLVSLFGPIFWVLGALLAYQISTSPISLRIERESLTIGYPFRQKLVPREQVQGARIEIGRRGLYRTVHLYLSIGDGAPEKILFDEMPPTELQTLLEDWLELPAAGSLEG